MFIIWKGEGIMVLITMIVTIVGAQFAADAVAISEDTGIAIGAFAAAFLIYKMDGFLKNDDTGLTVVDDETGESAPLVKHHDLYWIPVKYWTHINCVIGAWFTVAALQLV